MRRAEVIAAPTPIATIIFCGPGIDRIRVDGVDADSGTVGRAIHALNHVGGVGVPLQPLGKKDHHFPSSELVLHAGERQEAGKRGLAVAFLHHPLRLLQRGEHGLSARTIGDADRRTCGVSTGLCHGEQVLLGIFRGASTGVGLSGMSNCLGNSGPVGCVLLQEIEAAVDV